MVRAGLSAIYWCAADRLAGLLDIRVRTANGSWQRSVRASNTAVRLCTWAHAQHPRRESTHCAVPNRATGRGPYAALATNAAAGGIAGAVSLAAVYPFEFATVRMAADVGSEGGRQFGSTMRGALMQAVRKEGVLSAYRGFGVTVASTAFYKSLYFGFYVSMRGGFFP